MRTKRAVTATALAVVTSGFAVVGPAWADLTAPDLNEAWGVRLDTKIGLGAPTVADLNLDGTPEVLVGGHDGVVRAFRSDGSVLWAQAAQVVAGGPAVAVDASPTVADLDGDGSPEVIVNAQSLSVRAQAGGTIVFSATGAVKWRWGGGEDIFSVWSPTWGTRPDGFREGALTTAAVGDIDGDGQRDVVVAALDNRVHVLRGNDGVELAGWNSRSLPGMWVDDSLFSSPAVFDGDGDGRDEIYVGVASTPGGFIDHTGGAFLALGLVNGVAGIEWQQLTGEVMNSSPAIGDIDGDGRAEVVTGAGWDHSARNATPDARSVFAWHVNDGSALPGWPKVLNASTFSSPALGDVNGDGVADVVIATDPRPGAGTGDGHVYAFTGAGVQLWDRDPHQFVSQINAWEGGGGIIGSPAIADVNSDGTNDVVVSNPWGTFTMNGRDGSRIFAPIRKGLTSQNTPAVANFGGNWRIVLAGYDSASTSALVTVAIGAPKNTPPWPQWRGGAVHNGIAPAVGSAGGSVGGCPAVPLAGAASADSSPGAYHALAPVRILDTRSGLGAAKRVLPARCSMALSVAGAGGIPASGARAVTLNVTVTEPAANGYVTVFPCGTEPPNASNINFVAGQSVANLVTVGVGTGGQVCFYAYGAAHILADVAGWYGAAGDRLVPVTPRRFIDTRQNNPGRPAGRVGAGQVLTVKVAGVDPVPGGARAVSVNLTSVDANGPGYLTAYPCGQSRPDASNVNFTATSIVANHAVVPLAADGTVCVFAYADSHVIVDVMGYYGVATTGGMYRSLNPDRLVDTRNTGKLSSGQTMRIRVTGGKGVPASGASAVTVNVTAVDPDGPGYFSVFPCGGAAPVVSNLNYVKGANVPNYVTVGIGEGGDICLSTYAGSHAIVDLAGWFG
jgi:hypothetical protein